MKRFVALICVTLALAGGGTSFADTNGVVDSVKASVKSGWKKLEKYTDKISSLREERKSLPERSSWKNLWLNKTKSDQDEKIRKQLARVRYTLAFDVRAGDP